MHHLTLQVNVTVAVVIDGIEVARDCSLLVVTKDTAAAGSIITNTDALLDSSPSKSPKDIGIIQVRTETCISLSNVRSNSCSHPALPSSFALETARCRFKLLHVMSPMRILFTWRSMAMTSATRLFSAHFSP
jgi:hypothetical protein